MREEIEVLEHHSDLTPDGIDVDPRIGDDLSVDDDSTALNRLEEIDAAQERALAAAARTDDDENLAALDIQGHLAQHEV